MTNADFKIENRKPKIENPLNCFTIAGCEYKRNGFLFYFISGISYLVQNTQNRIQDSENVKDANNGPSEPT